MSALYAEEHYALKDHSEREAHNKEYPRRHKEYELSLVGGVVSEHRYKEEHEQEHQYGELGKLQKLVENIPLEHVLIGVDKLCAHQHDHRKRKRVAELVAGIRIQDAAAADKHRDDERYIETE